MAETVLGAVVQPVADSLFGALKEQLKYVVRYRAYIEDLDRALNDLKDIRVAVLHQIVAASRNAENIENEVTSWLDQVEKIIVEAKEVLEEHKNSKKGCFCSVVPNPSTRYRIAKQAGDKKKAIDELRRRRNEFGSISYPSEPPGIVTGTYAARGSEYFIPKSRVSILEEINKALLDPNVRIVGIWGASGVGKSTLLKEVEKQIHEKKFNYDFDEVAIAAVTGSPNPERIQEDLAYGLGLIMNENSIDQKAHRLRERLSQEKKFLIILDDIWKRVDLQKLGIPFDNDHPRIKLLLTSRTEEVLVGEMNSGRNFHLKHLEDDEAVDLFKQIVGDRSQEEAKLIDQLAKECAGLPILISPLAASLESLPSAKWVEALSELRRSHNLRMEEFIQNSLEFNYHCIEGEDAKSLFLLCGRLGKQIISVRDLLIYGTGLGLQKGLHSMEEAKGKLKSLLDILIDSCLLENYSERWVKLHDRIGDAALSIASKTHPSVIIRKSKLLTKYSDDDLTGCRSITMYLDDKMHELPEKLTCPNLDMLLIFGEKYQPTHLEIPDAFFKDLRELKVLDLSDFIITSLPSSIQFLSKLQALCLDRVTIEDIAMIGKFKMLQSLTFRGSKISRIPKEIGDLSNLRLLNLGSCRNLDVIESDVLGRLIYLEELTLPLDFTKWDEKGINNASLIELSNMSHLSNLTICVPNAVSFPSNMALQGLVEFNIQIGNVWAWKRKVEERTLRIELDSCSSKLICKEWLQIILKKTQDLDLHGWIGIEETFTKLSKEGFPQLKHIRVESCPSVKYIIHSKQNQPDPFPALESLSLFGLINLQEMCKGDLRSFGKLKVIKVESCDELRNLFSSSLARDLPLEEIEVSDCTRIEEVIVDEGEKVELRHLRKLKLVNLRSISSFCSNANQRNDSNSLFEFLDGRRVSLSSLESLILCELPMLRKISDGQHRVNLHNLKSLQLLKCNSLTYALDSNLLQQLKNLGSMEVEDCESMETIFQLNTYEATSNQSLQINLKLRNLPKLKKIWNGNLQVVSFVLQRIKKLEVFKCDELENLFTTSMARSLGKISHISIASCKTIEEIFEEENGDLEIEFLSLSYLCISNMENLTVFSHGNHRYRFPCLMQLIISQCPIMTTFVSCRDATFFNQKVNLPRLDKVVLASLKSLISIWGNNLSKDSFCKLASIEIANCESLSSIFHSHLGEKLQNLTKVRLLGLPQLRHVVEEALTLPTLREITVKDCHSLTYLFPHAVAWSLSELANMNISSCKDLSEVVSFNGIENDMASTKAMRFDNLSSLKFENLEGLVYFCPRHYDLYFPILKKLSIIGCKNLKAFVRGSSNSDRPEVRLPEASSSTNVEVDFSPLFDEKVVFPNLEELQIKGLEVKEIWPKKEPASFHMELKNLEVEGCHQLSTIVPSFMLHKLHSLECLSVKSCNSVKAIFELEKDNSRRQKILKHLRKLRLSSCVSIQHIIAIQHVVAMRDDDYIGETYYRTFIFPQLSSLTLSELPELGSFCQENYKIELLSIVELEIKDCQTVKVLIADSRHDCKPLLLVEKMEFPKMVSMVISKMQNLTKLWHISEESTHSECSLEAFYKLKRLEVEECGSLSTVFPAKMIRAFHNLEELTVVDSELLESVFESTGSRSETESNNFNHVVSSTFALRNLGLKGLPGMNHVWKVEDPKWVSLSFEKLHSIRINDCRSLIHLFPASLARSLHQLWCLTIEYCQGMKEIVWSGESALQQSLSTSPESTNFSLGMHSLKWPSLQIMTIRKCPNAKILSSSLPKNKDAVTNIDSLPKVDIPRLQRMIIDASILENGQFIDEIYGNPTELRLTDVENQAWVQSNPWSLLLERFPQLRALTIWRSDSREIFPSENENVGAVVPYKPQILDMAKRLVIIECHHLTILPAFLALFNNLTLLKVGNCNGLHYLVTSSVASGLLQLTVLEIYECENLEEIMKCNSDENGDRAKHDDYMISFPKLKRLFLCDLPVLQSFSSTSCKFNFPSLRDVYMMKLPKMHVFCEGELITPYKHRIARNIRALYNQEVEWWWIHPGS